MAGAGAQSQERLSHLAPGSREWQSLRGGDSSRDLPAAERLGYNKMGKEHLGKILLLRQSWNFGLQQDPTLCQRELGKPWGSLVTPLHFHSSNNVPSW